MNIKNIIGSAVVIIILLCIILLLYFKHCNYNRTQTDSNYVDSILSRQKGTEAIYKSKLDSVNVLLLAKADSNKLKNNRILQLEEYINNLSKKHAQTKQQLQKYNSDTGYVIAPNEYVNECESCFDSIYIYKKLNEQLRFERDSYDTLMRQQNSIATDRVGQLEKEKQQWEDLYKNATTYRCDTTRKLKFSVAGMANSLFLQRAGGFGFIYEDKKFNEFGAHILFSSQGNIYIINAAKKITFKRKK